MDEYLTQPTKGPSSVFAILFAISGGLHIFQNSKYKSWAILWLLPCSSIVFAAGFISNEYNAFHPEPGNQAAPSQGLLYSGVPILLASLYLVLLHLMVTQTLFSKHFHSVIWFMVALLISAIISLTAQATSNLFNPKASPATIRSDLAILKAGLVLLLFSNASFFGILGWFHRRCHTGGVFHENANRKTKILTLTLYAASTLILVRNIFRVVQIFSSPHSHAWRTEAFFWVFDATPLVVCSLLLNAMHPGKFMDARAGCANAES